MWPFTKKRKNEPESAWDGPWAVMQGQRHEDLLIARVNQRRAGAGGRSAAVQRVMIGVQLNHPHENGMPTSEEGQELGAIEDALMAALESDRRAILVAARTCAGTRQLDASTLMIRSGSAACEQVIRSVHSPAPDRPAYRGRSGLGELSAVPWRGRREE